jgi:hypothetical protein
MSRRTCFGPPPGDALLGGLGLTVPPEAFADPRRLYEQVRQMVQAWDAARRRAQDHVSQLGRLRTATSLWRQCADEFVSETYRVGLRLLEGQLFGVSSTIRSTEDLRYWCLLQTEVLGLIRKAYPFHFCKRGDVQLGDGGVLQLLAEVLAEPPAPRLVSDNRLLGWWWVKSYPDDPIADDPYQREVEESTRDGEEGPPYDPEASDYEELAFFLWTAVRELAGEGEVRPARPAAVHNMASCEHALDLVYNWCCPGDLSEQCDGLTEDGRFCFGGEDYIDMSPLSYHLLCHLWDPKKRAPKSRVSFADAISKLYGECGASDEAFTSVVKRLRAALRAKKFPGKVRIRSAHLWLELTEKSSKKVRP